MSKLLVCAIACLNLFVKWELLIQTYTEIQSISATNSRVYLINIQSHNMMNSTNYFYDDKIKRLGKSLIVVVKKIEYVSNVNQ